MLNDELNEYKQSQKAYVNTFNKAGFSLDAINNMVSSVNENASCNSECQKEKNIEILYQNWQDKLNLKENLPEQEKEAHKKWYIAVYGEEAYYNLIQERLTKETNKQILSNSNKNNNLQNEINNLEEKNKKLVEVNNTLRDYKNKLNSENKLLEIKLDEIIGNINKNNRKFDYENIEIKNILVTKYFVIFLYYIIFVLFIIFGNLSVNNFYKNKKIIILMILYIIFPFLVNYYQKIY
tara:strand:- start:4299 stop:5009 length:711 start_codon:yes stop_codon:yes gene_type:complete